MNNPSNGKDFIDSGGEMIVSTPGTCGGRPRISGHRIRVQDVVAWRDRMGMAPDEMMAEFPGMTMSKIQAALAYYENHRNEIDAALKLDDALADELERELGSVLDRFPRKMDAQVDSLPPG